MHRNDRKLIFPGLVCLVLLLLIFGSVYAQESTPVPSDDQVNAVAKQLFCPVCENIPLDVCPTQACAQWRALIGEKLAAGWTEEQIKEYFVLQYGDRVLSEPPRHGINWLIYILPPIFIVFSGLIVFRVLRGMRKPEKDGVHEEVENVDQDDKYLKRLDEELKKRDR